MLRLNCNKTLWVISVARIHRYTTAMALLPLQANKPERNKEQGHLEPQQNGDRQNTNKLNPWTSQVVNLLEILGQFRLLGEKGPLMGQLLEEALAPPRTWDGLDQAQVTSAHISL